ncbi:hypothetical protein [Aureivirga sp. CE67]|uniref:hypothetical protein n=1 Tax=Aureivirga sp. CE67 TaxID=1788983 RepID=UPI0018C98818|nr:hypothetical protein [Aureivirga sp. CE67]
MIDINILEDEIDLFEEKIESNKLFLDNYSNYLITTDFINPDRKKKENEYRNKFQKKFEFKLSEDFCSLYDSKFSKLITEWKYHHSSSKQNILIYGGSCIMPIGYYINKTKEIIEYINEEIQEGYVSEYDKCIGYWLKTGDYHLFAIDETGTTVFVKFTAETHELYLYLEDGTLHKLQVKIEEYLDLLVKTKGLFRWQLYLTEDYPLQLKNTLYDGFFENMEELFPEVDLSAFSHREHTNPEHSINSILRTYRFGQRWFDVLNPDKVPEGITVLDQATDNYIWTKVARVPQEFYNLELRLGYTLPDAFKAYMFELSGGLWGTLFKWLINGDDNQFASASVKTLRLDNIFGVYVDGNWKPSDTALKYFDSNQEQLPQLKGKYLFYQDNYTEIIIEPIADGVLRSYLRHSFDDEYMNLIHITDDMDFLLEMMLQTRGMHMWNYLLAVQNPEIYEGFKKRMQKYFPEVDLSPYEKIQNGVEV